MSRALRCSLVALSLACATEETELSRRVRGIQQREAAEISDPANTRLELALADGATTFCPAALKPAQLRATVRTPTVIVQTPVKSKTATPGYLPHHSVVVTIAGAALGPEWILTTPGQPAALLEMLTKPTTVSAHLRRHPTVTSTLQLKANFDCDQVVEFPGRPGREGGKGARPGEPGEDGLDVVVSVAYLRPSDGQRLALVKVAPSAGSPAYFLLQSGRRLGISLRGGDGGSGGDSPVSDLVSGGLGGDGGNGGRAVINVDPRYPELRSVVAVVSPGGRGGEGGSNGDFQGSKAASGRSGRAGQPPRQQTQSSDKMFGEELEAGVPILSGGPDTPI